MKNHTVFGYEIIKEKENFSKAIALAVLQHHKKMNGKVDTIVELSNGEKAKVIKNNEGSVLRVTVVGIATGKVYHLDDDLSCIICSFI